MSSRANTSYVKATQKRAQAARDEGLALYRTLYGDDGPARFELQVEKLKQHRIWSDYSSSPLK